jgi:hypothetical protein
MFFFWRVVGFSWSLEFLRGGPKKESTAFFDQQNFNLFSQHIFLKIFCPFKLIRTLVIKI